MTNLTHDPLHGTAHMEKVSSCPIADARLQARKEVEALGYLTSETAIRIRSLGMDPATLERRLLDGAV